MPGLAGQPQLTRGHEQGNGACNAHLDNAAVERHCTPNAAGLAILERAMQRLGLSPRGYHRILKVARTLDDMSGGPQIEVGQTEALGLRSLDRCRAAQMQR
jgi:magnesium chelatase family protein